MCFHNLSLHVLCFSTHFLFCSNSHCTTFFRTSLSDFLIRFRLVSLQLSANVTSHVYVSDIDGQDFECSTRIKAFTQYSTGNVIWIFQYICMFFRGTYSRYDTFTYTGNNCGFTSTTNEAIDIRTYSNTSTNFQFDTIFCYRRNNWSFNHFRINGHLNRFQYITTGEVDSCGTFKGQRNRCPFSGNQSIHNAVNVTTCKVMRFQLIYIHIKPRFISFNQRHYNLRRIYATQAHTYKCKDTNINARC